MAFYLLDTNVLLRLADAADPSNGLAVDAVARLLRQGDQPVITPQTLVELWAVASRPKANNGLEWSVQRISAVENDLLARFPLLEEGSGIFRHWLDLVTLHEVKGKQVHDARLAAVLLSHGQRHIVTFNTSDFKRFSEIAAIHPSEVISTVP